MAINATFYFPGWIVLDTVGNMFIADSRNNVVRRISTSGVITTVAGNGSGAGTIGGYSGDGGLAVSAELNEINSIAVDVAGNLYIDDEGNQRIRKVNKQGIITTIAGNGTAGFSGDNGPATSAQIHDAIGLTIDAFGNLYFADQYNNRIRKIDTFGMITTVAGNGNTTFSGDGGSAISAGMQPVSALQYNDSLYIVDYGSEKIRKINNLGIISTIAGNGTRGYSGDGGPAISAEFHLPVSVAFDPIGNLYIVDQDNERIRKITYVMKDTVKHTGVSTLNANSSFSIYPNPATDVVHMNLPQSMSYTLLNIVGATMQQGILKAGNNTIPVQSLPTGMYLLQLTNGQQKTVHKIVVNR